MSIFLICNAKKSVISNVVMRIIHLKRNAKFAYLNEEVFSFIFSPYENILEVFRVQKSIDF